MLVCEEVWRLRWTKRVPSPSHCSVHGRRLSSEPFKSYFWIIIWFLRFGWPVPLSVDRLEVRLVLTTAVWSHPILAAGSDTVQLPFGSIRGNLNQASREFLGVPYATARRFEAPQQWSQQYARGVLDATSYGPQCPQLYPSPGATISEECLFLNVFTPSHQPQNSAPLPVLL